MGLCIWLCSQGFYMYVFSRLYLLHGVTMDIGVENIGFFKIHFDLKRVLSYRGQIIAV